MTHNGKKLPLLRALVAVNSANYGHILPIQWPYSALLVAARSS